MKCLGRTKIKERCKNNVKWSYPFCKHHRWQLLILLFITLPTFLGVYAGLFQDLVKPLFYIDDETKQLAVISQNKSNHIKYLDTKADSISKIISMEIIDNPSSAPILIKLKDEFTRLQEEQIQALKNDQYSRNHELIGEIHQLPKKLKIINDSIKKDSRESLNDPKQQIYATVDILNDTIKNQFGFDKKIQVASNNNIKTNWSCTTGISYPQGYLASEEILNALENYYPALDPILNDSSGVYYLVSSPSVKK